MISHPCSQVLPVGISDEIGCPGIRDVDSIIVVKIRVDRTFELKLMDVWPVSLKGSVKRSFLRTDMRSACTRLPSRMA